MALTGVNICAAIDSILIYFVVLLPLILFASMLAY